MTTLKKYLILAAMSMFLFAPDLSDASVIDAGSVRVTNVTPVQFSVVWGGAEPATLREALKRSSS